MRIAYLVNQYPAVSHSFIRREIRALEAHGIDVTRFAIRRWSGTLVDPDDVEEANITNYVLSNPFAMLHALFWALIIKPRSFARAIWLSIKLARRSDRPFGVHLAYFAEACRLLRMLPADIVHLHAHFGGNSAEVALLAKELGGPPFSFTVHGPEEYDRAAAISIQTKVANAAFVVVVSSYGRAQLFRWLDNEHWLKIKLIHCGLDKERFPAGGIPPTVAPKFVCVGRLCRDKAQGLLIEALAHVRANGYPAELVLVGDGDERERLQSAINSLRLEDAVRITGWATEQQVRDEISAARALVSCSFAENLPLVIMEAMALRRPVIATCIAGIPELVRSGRTGWLVPAGDVLELARAIMSCMTSDAQELRNMGELGQAAVWNEHDVNIEARKLAALFMNTANQAR